jgi:hypothetical protein
VLAHERAHLRYRHYLMLAVAAALARAFPRVPLFAQAGPELGVLAEMAAGGPAAIASVQRLLAPPGQRQARRAPLPATAGLLLPAAGTAVRPGETVTAPAEPQQLDLIAHSEQPPRVKCRPRRKAEQALFDVHHRIVDRCKP